MGRRTAGHFAFGVIQFRPGLSADFISNEIVNKKLHLSV